MILFSAGPFPPTLVWVKYGFLRRTWRILPFVSSSLPGTFFVPTRRLAFLAFFALVVLNWPGVMILAMTKAMKAIYLRSGCLRGSSHRISPIVKVESPP